MQKNKKITAFFGGKTGWIPRHCHVSSEKNSLHSMILVVKNPIYDLNNYGALFHCSLVRFPNILTDSQPLCHWTCFDASSCKRPLNLVTFAKQKSSKWTCFDLPRTHSQPSSPAGAATRAGSRALATASQLGGQSDRWSCGNLLYLLITYNYLNQRSNLYLSLTLVLQFFPWFLFLVRMIIHQLFQNSVP